MCRSFVQLKVHLNITKMWHNFANNYLTGGNANCVIYISAIFPTNLTSKLKISKPHTPLKSNIERNWITPDSYSYRIINKILMYAKSLIFAISQTFSFYGHDWRIFPQYCAYVSRNFFKVTKTVNWSFIYIYNTHLN